MSTFETKHFTNADLRAFMKDSGSLFDGSGGPVEYHGDTQTGVSVTHPAEGKAQGVTIIPRSYEAMLVPIGVGTHAGLETARDQLIANITGRTVIGVDTPGFGAGGNEQVPVSLIVKAALSGRMNEYTRTQFDAILEACPELREAENVSFLGYSMGAFATAAMLGQVSEYMPNATVDNIHLVEFVNDQNYSLLGKKGLLHAIGEATSEEKTQEALRINDEYGLPTAFDCVLGDSASKDEENAAILDDAKKRGNISNLALGMAMCRGAIPTLLQSLKVQRAIQEKSILVHYDRFAGSSVVRPDSFKKSIGQLSADGHMVYARELALRSIEGGSDHPPRGGNKHSRGSDHTAWQSLPFVSMTVQERKKQ